MKNDPERKDKDKGKSDGDSQTFDSDRLRLIVGVLAISFPFIVIALVGRITMSISASYYEENARDAFVGFLFIIGALLVSYKGHKLDLTAEEQQLEKDGKKLSLRSRSRIYQEEWISSVGGVAAVFTVICPTAKDPAVMDLIAYIHVGCAFIMFGAIAYFCLVAFPRSLNKKLVVKKAELQTRLGLSESGASDSPGDADIFSQIPFFVRFSNQAWAEYQKQDMVPFSRLSEDAPKVGKVLYMWLAYEKMLSRGFVYLFCGPAILLTLVAFLVMVFGARDFVNKSNVTFYVEFIALVLFGVAWFTASKLPFKSLIPIENRLARRSKTTTAVQQAV